MRRGITHVARHALAGEHAAGRLALTDRARRTVRDRDTVRGRAAAEIVALHDAGVALADGRARHVDDLAGLEQIDLELAAGARSVPSSPDEAELDQRLARSDLDLGVMARRGLLRRDGCARRRRPARRDSRRSPPYEPA